MNQIYCKKMKSWLFLLCLVVCLVDSSSGHRPEKSWNLDTCTFTYQGKTYDLSPLIANNGSWVFEQTMYQIDGTNIFDANSPETINYTFQVQVCQNVQPLFLNCKTPSPVNVIDKSGNCTALGDINAATFDINPYADGVYLTYYHGDAVNHMQHHEARIYFVCATSPSPIFVEHLKTFYQWHFMFKTPLAC